MSCANTGPFYGGTWNDATIINPAMIGGKATDLEVSGLRLVNNVVIDESSARALAQALCPHMADCIEITAEQIAAVFTDCYGKPHTPNTAIPTCEQMNDAINAAIIHDVANGLPVTTEGEDVPTTFIGASRDQLLARPDAYIKIGDYVVPAYVPVTVNP